MIQVQDIGKRYQKEWIFRHFSADFQLGKGYAITGQNGSGKSTLMQVLSGYLSPSQGAIRFGTGTELDREAVYREVSFAAPYIDLIEEFSLHESIAFHRQFKPLVNGWREAEVLDCLQLTKRATHQPLRYFSSGMRQRVKLAFAILAQTPILLLDEPTITLDSDGVRWYQSLLQQHSQGRLLIVASNVPSDYELCSEVFSIMDYK